jgi:hypothetical protein
LLLQALQRAAFHDFVGALRARRQPERQIDPEVAGGATGEVAPPGPSLLIVIALGGTLALAGVLPAGIVRDHAIAQVSASDRPAVPLRFRYDEQSGRCLDTQGRAGYNPGSRDLMGTREAECADFSGRGLNLTYLRLTGANLRGANFANVPWYLGSITNSDLTGAILSGTSGQMDYRGSRFRKARLSGADVRWADFRDADLEGADLGGALFNQHTQLPFDNDEARRRGMIFTPEP